MPAKLVKVWHKPGVKALVFLALFVAGLGLGLAPQPVFAFG